MKPSRAAIVVLALMASLLLNAATIGTMWFHECQCDEISSQSFGGTAGTAIGICRPAKLIRIIDGDTIECSITLASKQEIGSEFTITTAARLYGINSPDTATEGAGPTKAATENLRKLTAKFCKDGNFVAELHGRDKYGRTLLVMIGSDGTDLNQRQIKDNHAKIYLP